MTENFFIINRRGKRIPATLEVPQGTSKGLAIALHGLAGWKDQTAVMAMREGALLAGYTVLSFDGADCLKGPDASFWNSTTTGFLEDTEDVIEYAKMQSWGSAHIILLGHSLGGMVALRLFRMYEKSFEALVLVAPAISWNKDRAGRFLKRVQFLTSKISAVPNQHGAYMPLYPKWILDFLSFDSRRDAPYVTSKVLIVSAENDHVVAEPKAHEALGRRMHGATTHVVIPEAAHTFDKHKEVLTDTIRTWLSSS